MSDEERRPLSMKLTTSNVCELCPNPDAPVFEIDGECTLNLCVDCLDELAFGTLDVRRRRRADLERRSIFPKSLASLAALKEEAAGLSPNIAKALRISVEFAVFASRIGRLAATPAEAFLGQAPVLGCFPDDEADGMIRLELLIPPELISEFRDGNSISTGALLGLVSNAVEVAERVGDAPTKEKKR